jgi:hypothetical protein
MKLSDRVKVKDSDNVDLVHRGRTGTVIADTAPGKPVEVEFDDETVPHSFHEADLEAL